MRGYIEARARVCADMYMYACMDTHGHGCMCICKDVYECTYVSIFGNVLVCVNVNTPHSNIIHHHTL